MKKLLLSAVLSLILLQVYSQGNDNFSDNKTIKHHNIYAEIGGNSGFYSLNYDYLFVLTPYTKLVVGTGTGFNLLKVHPDGSPRSDNNFFVTPQASFLFSTAAHHIELGISYTSNGDAFVGRFGYRYQRATGGFLFRLAFTPAFGKDKVPWVTEGFVQPLFGLSIGYTF